MSPTSGSAPAIAPERRTAVADALAQLGEHADPKRIAEAVKIQAGIEIDPGEVALIIDQLRAQAATEPSPDQPPPENGRRTTPG